jgi:hypothetical protein
MIEALQQTFAAQARDGLTAVKPDVFEFVFGCHGIGRVSGFGYSNARLSVHTRRSFAEK